MNSDNPYQASSTRFSPTEQRSLVPWLTFVVATPAAIGVVLIVVAMRYGYWTMQNFLYQGVIHPQGSLIALATLIGGMAWLLTAACWRRRERVVGCAFASAGIACFVWLSMLT